ncbi:DMT family transporter [Photobacterium sp. GB-72]|uniref:DMT family transporter n=1 Tax=Photobacterium sp. GB-72 TaxID=2022105 RepID=UPI001E318A8D|nr:DMT family transporter [Photobacterium sp. GB-72]
MGALFVAFNCYVLSKVGATLTVILVITGQLLTGVVWDAISNGVELTPLLGILCILMGILVTKRGQDQKANIKG